MWIDPKSKAFAVVAASALSLVGGAAGGVLIANKRLERKYQALLIEENLRTKAFYESFYKVGEHSDPEKLAEKILGDEASEAGDAMRDYSQYDTTSQEVPQEILEKIAGKMAEAEAEVAAEAEPLSAAWEPESPFPKWDQENEELERKNGVPYIISTQEFLENEHEYEENNFTWYEGDSVMADSRDEVIPNHEVYVGTDATESFGRGSDDPNVVYVCNEKMEHIYEICRSTKSYSEDVLGLVTGGELKHGQRKFRKDRDYE